MPVRGRGASYKRRNKDKRNGDHKFSWLALQVGDSGCSRGALHRPPGVGAGTLLVPMTELHRFKAVKRAFGQHPWRQALIEFAQDSLFSPTGLEFAGIISH